MTSVQPAPTRPDAPTIGTSLSVDGARVALGGQEVLHGVGLRLQEGRTLALLGPSGCGKTTLLRAIAGLQDLDAGQVRLGGEDVTRVPAERRGVGMVFQDGALFPHMDVATNVGFGLPRGQDRTAPVAEALAMVGLDGFGDRMPATLSGGQAQRVALARALVAQPRILLLDEPFSALDAGLRAQIRADVAALLRRLGITTVVVTHDQEEAFLLGDEVAVMIDGTIHQQERPEVVYHSPATREMAVFLGEASLVPADGEGDVARTWLGPVPLATPLSGAVDLLLRPEHLRMTAGDDMTVESVEYFGHDALTRLRGPAGTAVVRTMSLPPHAVGDRVSVAYDGPPATGYPAA